ncbi:two-component system, chemotaxis family, response regulator CheY [Methylobacterium phyllostachyos]|uniref:Two-component system, chemotaxis family, response regulator CheY n=1 Tax=Methylobacterium phyllostachyos TaxID=582672 RepID=A0A1G9YCA7_9HYPH|nr:response regulator [Methylobacterium phyllostachyos]SDN06752.1 two-component system, chemotaxis family, response regulator CheY [Methylobacterium phyllostachyos]
MYRVLIVDDSPTILASMSGILNSAGYAVERAANAEEALKKIQSGLSPALVITDYHMPGMHGVQLIQELRKLTQTRFTPMLVLTTESQQEKRDEARKAGATGWLVKPVQADKLLQVVRQVAPSLQARAA